MRTTWPNERQNMLTPQWIPAKWLTQANRSTVDLVVIHTTETPCVSGMALRIGQGFQKGDRQVSAHYVVDPGTIVHCVHESDVAWHCPGANRNGVGVEHCGFTLSPAPTDWLHDGHAAGMMDLSAQLVADICKRWSIPVIHLSPAQLADGERGIVAHADATIAFGTPGGHVDGSTWPWDEYLAAVNKVLVTDPAGNQ